jgi:DNA-binding IclR family transcriptional regulator
MSAVQTSSLSGLATSAPGHSVRGVESPRRVLQVLLAFSEERPHATISELAKEIDVPVSTCYRYVGLLRELGLLDEGSRATYHVTPRVMLIARAAKAANSLGDVARPILERVSAIVNETTLLMQRFHSLVVCVESVASNRAVRYIFESGNSLPLGLGASGKLLLASLPESERADYLDQVQVRDPELARRLMANESELPTYAAEGWAGSDGEYENGVWAGAAAIREPLPGDGAVAAAIVVAGPSFRIDPSDRMHIRGVLLEAAAELTAKLGR